MEFQNYQKYNRLFNLILTFWFWWYPTFWSKYFEGLMSPTARPIDGPHFVPKTFYWYFYERSTILIFCTTVFLSSLLCVDFFIFFLVEIGNNQKIKHVNFYNKHVNVWDSYTLHPATSHQCLTVTWPSATSSSVASCLQFIDDLNIHKFILSCSRHLNWIWIHMAV